MRTETVLSWFIAAIFALAAGFVIWFLAMTFTMHYAARKWVATPAAVRHYDMRTGKSFGKTGPTIQERLVAAYTYTFAGRTYAGNRVDFSFGFDNFSTSRRKEQLALLHSGNIIVYVDPALPGQSIMDRRLPGEQVVFSLIFLLFPCGIGTLAVVGVVSSGLSKLGCGAAERYTFPVVGLVHSIPALYPILFEPGTFGPAGWIVLAAFAGLSAISMRSIWRRIKDPSLGSPKWPDRFTGTGGQAATS